MQLYGSIDSLIEYSAPLDCTPAKSEPVVKRNGDDGLDNILHEKVLCLKTILNHILGEIQQRKALSSTIKNTIDYHYCYLKTKLIELATWEFGINKGIEQRRSRLEKQLDGLLQEQRQEQQKQWQDTAALNKEFRAWFKQYSDLMQRVRIINQE